MATESWRAARFCSFEMMKYSEYQPRIVLYDIVGACLILVHKSGVVYQNQVFGTNCCQKEQEGVLAPSGLDDKGVEAISKIDYYASECIGLNAHIADLLDAILHADRVTEFISVDRTRLERSGEAWVGLALRSGVRRAPNRPRQAMA